MDPSKRLNTVHCADVTVPLSSLQIPRCLCRADLLTMSSRVVVLMGNLKIKMIPLFRQGNTDKMRSVLKLHIVSFNVIHSQ